MGPDWDQMTACEKEVFGLDPKRLATMVTAWDCFRAFIDPIAPGAYSEEALEEARDALPRLARSDESSVLAFAEFAMTVCGLTQHEAEAIFGKMRARELRNRVLTFNDEPR